MLKIIYKTIALAAAFVAGVGCSNQEEIYSSYMSVVSFEAMVHKPGSKISLDTQTGKSSWNEGDKIRIFWGTGANDNSTATAQSSGETTTFLTDTEIPTDKPGYWAIYPSTQNATLKSGVLEPDFSQSNRFATFEEAAIATAYTSSAGGSFAFKNACALVEFTTKRTNLRKVSFRADALVGGTTEEVTMLLGNGSTHPYQAGTYYIPLSPGTSVGEFTLRLKSKNGADLPAYHNADDRKFEASKIYSLGSIDSRIPFESVSGKTSFRVMSFNILRGDLHSTDEHAWGNRREACLAMLDADSPDIIGLQECNSEQRKEILDRFPEYAAVGISVKGEAVTAYPKVSSNPIIYRASYFTLEDWGTFWLSDTPDKFSNTWYYDKPRTTTWARFNINGTDVRFLYINTHLQDNKSSINEQYIGQESKYGEECRDKQMEVVLNKMNEVNPEGYPMLLGGDFNSKVVKEKFLWWVTAYYPCFEELLKIMSDASSTATVTDTGLTNNGFGSNSDSVVDHIFHSHKFIVTTYAVDRSSYLGVTYLSDHYPVYADVTLDGVGFGSSLEDWSVQDI